MLWICKNIQKFDWIQLGTVCKHKGQRKLENLYSQGEMAQDDDKK